LIFHIAFSETGKFVDFEGETAPDFDAILVYFGRILGGSEIYNPT
jgi:hypothetical protein